MQTSKLHCVEHHKVPQGQPNQRHVMECIT